MNKPPLISVIIPVHNGERTIAACVEAVLACRGPRREVIVVDDGSTDRSAAIAARYHCRLLRHRVRRGAAAARNTGAAAANGDILFFCDADCIAHPRALAIAAAAMRRHGAGAVIGGTYSVTPVDNDFFSRFQSALIHYAESKRPAAPDYIASHAMVMDARMFRRANGFREDFMPMIEDVEFSHRLRGLHGCRLRMEPGFVVRHHFGFTLGRSLANAFVKARFWCRYSRRRGDLWRDSGCASLELKAAGALAGLTAALLAASMLTGSPPLWLDLIPPGLSLLLARRFLALCRRAHGWCFCALAALYYLAPYPAAAAAGCLTGLLDPKAPRLNGERAAAANCRGAA